MKPIRLTPQAIQAAKCLFDEQLKDLRFQGEKFNFTYNFEEEFKKSIPETIEKPTVYMSSSTYLKMLQFVLLCDKEIAWHGVVERKGSIFFIKDVFLYPQRITTVTVQTDDTKYTQWAEKLPDETFNTMRFQGHSHVNMGTTPSGTDLTNWNEFLQNLLDDDYYIFAIMNKSQDLNLCIYDLANNLIYEKSDITFRVLFNKDLEMSHLKEEMETYIEKPKAVSDSGTGLYYRDYWDKYRLNKEDDRPLKKSTQTMGFAPTVPVKKAAVKIKRHVVLMNRNGRSFEKEHPEYEGDRISVRQNGVNHEVFVPYSAFQMLEIQYLREDGWHVREMPIPEEYDV